MERGGSSAYSSVPNNSACIDKNRVLDIKPLRQLAPIFPNTPHQGHSQASPLMSLSPSGPFPPGFSTFYPFSTPQWPDGMPDLNHQAPCYPTPLRAFKSTQAHESNGDYEESYDNSPKRLCGSKSRGSNSSQKLKKKQKNNLDPNLSLSIVGCNAPGISSVPGITQSERDNGDRDVVTCVRMTYDALRRRLSQLEEVKELRNGVNKRSDLRAGNILMSTGFRTNMKRRIGAIPGVEIGDIFFFRIELCVVGLHAPSMAGIDYMNFKDGFEDEPVALSIVSSGGYEDDVEDCDVLVYTGHGGNANYKDKPTADQKLVRGNLALERSLRRANEVRVIRGMKDVMGPAAKVYVYDGLYKVQETWIEKGKSGCNIFKYKLVRNPGQPGAFSVWKSIQKWKESLSSRVGLVLPDLTSGAETIPVSLVNDIDGEKGPTSFTYFPTLKYSKAFFLSQPAFGCNCRNACSPGDPNCSCIQKNDGEIPYTMTGSLVSRKPLIYECGPSCPCIPNCKNRVSQMGIKVRLEVFKTKDKGWGLRSWDPIRAGTFICEYAGEVIDKVRKGDEAGCDEYIFDTTRVYESFKWNYEPEFLEEESTEDAIEEYNIPSPLVISSKHIGNVARFMNHSCSPNLFWQPVLYEHNGQSFLHIAFYAIRHIPPLTELTFDYGITRSDGAEGETRRRKKCFCGSSKCRGFFC